MPRSISHKMPKIKTLNARAPPAGWELISDDLEAFDERLKSAERESGDGKRRCEVVWPIFKIHHQRSRYLYQRFYVNKEISRELYEYCVKQGHADINLIAKWRKPGYERLCCLRCIDTGAQHFGTSCICRVPKKDLEPGRIIECIPCGCNGCASCDFD